MKGSIKKLLLAKTIAILLLLTIFPVTGCSDDNPADAGSESVTEDLFPLVVGRQLVYNGYLRDPQTDQNNTNFAAYQAKWTIASNAAPSPGGGSANLVIDSTFAPVGWIETPLIIRRNQPTGSGSMSILQSLAPFYEAAGIQSADTLKWLHLYFDKGLDTDFTAFDTTLTVTQGSVRLHCVSRLKANVSVSVNGTTYNTYELSTRIIIYVNGNVYQEKPYGTFWFAPNIGPVKMIINARANTPGHYRELVGKNF